MHDQSFPTEHCRTSDGGGAVLTCLLSFCGAGAVLFVFCMCDTVSSPTLLSISTQIHLLCSANYLTLSVKSVTWRTMHGFSSRQNGWEREMTWIAFSPQGDGDVHVLLGVVLVITEMNPSLKQQCFNRGRAAGELLTWALLRVFFIRLKLKQRPEKTQQTVGASKERS